jgi:hypothetical protein
MLHNVSGSSAFFFFFLQNTICANGLSTVFLDNALPAVVRCASAKEEASERRRGRRGRWRTCAGQRVDGSPFQRYAQLGRSKRQPFGAAAAANGGLFFVFRG